MSGQIRQGFAGYVGIMNGIAYHIDSALHASWKPVELVPVGLQSNALLAPPDVPPPAPASSGKHDGSSVRTGQRATVERVPVQQDESLARLFTREGSEPLRAGHPDLWRLLIAGTCLEGNSFKSI